MFKNNVIKILLIICIIIISIQFLHILSNIPRYLNESFSYIKDFFDIDNTMAQVYKKEGNLTEDELRKKIIIDEKYFNFLKQSFPKNYDMIIRELTRVDFKHPITKASYFIHAQKPDIGDTILMFSSVDWMVSWPSSKFFQYNWINIAPQANTADATPKENKIYTDENIDEIVDAVNKHKPKYILAVFVFTKVFEIPGYTPIYAEDLKYGGAIVYKKNN